MRSVRKPKCQLCKRYAFVGLAVAGNGKKPTITVCAVFGTDGLLVDITPDDIRNKGDTLLISLRPSDERLFVEAGIDTVSMHTLVSIAGGCCFSVDDINGIFRRVANMNYSQIFVNNNGIDYTILFRSHRFWKKIAGFARGCLDMIQQNGMMLFLSLEVRVTPVLHRMFDAGYPVDVKRALALYKGWRKTLSDIQIQMRNIHATSPCNEKNQVKCRDSYMQEQVHLQQKTEDKIRRFPSELLKCGEPKAVIYCNYRSVGTDTFRITTNHTNIQGLPKEIRKCLLPRYGCMLVEYDIVSSQLVILACLTGEEQLIRLYQKGNDLYSYIAAKLTGRHEPEIKPAERDVYKKAVLQILYGAGTKTIRKELLSSGYEMSHEETLAIKKRFYRLFPSIKKYSDKIRQTGTIQFPTGRKWEVADIVKPYKRLAYVLQYIEAGLLRQTLVLMDKKADKQRFWVYLCIHDSIFVEMDKDDHPIIQSTVQECFNQAMHRCFPEIQHIRIKEEIIYYGRNENG